MKLQALRTRPARLRTSVTRPATNHAEIAIKKILAPTDFSPASKKALKYAIRFARDFGSELTLLHVVEPTASASFDDASETPAFSKADMADAEDRLRTLVRDAGMPGIKSTIRMGLAAHEVVEVAKALHADMIVIGTRDYEGWKHLVVGSTAARVARAAPCPVLVVREEEHDFV